MQNLFRTLIQRPINAPRSKIATNKDEQGHMESIDEHGVYSVIKTDIR